jgi:hypothetical protein
MRSRLILASALVMMAFGMLSVWEKPVRAEKGTCCAPGNPYTCGSAACEDYQTCTILSGTCP